MQYDKHEKLRYTVRGKKAFPVTNNGLLSFNIKGRCNVDKEFKEVGVSLNLLNHRTQNIIVCEYYCLCFLLRVTILYILREMISIPN